MAYVKSLKDKGAYFVFWGADHKKPLDGVLFTSEWAVIGVEQGFRSGKVEKSYYPTEDVIRSWALVKAMVRRKQWADAQVKQGLGLDPTHVPGPNGSCFQGQSLKKTKFPLAPPPVPEKKKVHPAIKDIDDRFGGISKRAVAIFPGSWLDNKLQEAYYSRRKEGKESS